MHTDSARSTRIPRSVWKVAILGGMASYLDGGALVTGGIALSLLMPSVGLTAWDLGILSALLTGGLAIGALIGGHLGDRYGRKRVFSIDLLLLALGLLLNVIAVDRSMVYVGFVLTGLAMGADLPVSIALVAEEAPPEHRGKLVGLSQVFWGLGPSVTIVLSAVMGNLGLAPATMARLLWGHLLAVALVVWLLRRRLPESRQWADAQAATQDAAVAEQLGQAGSIRRSQLGLLRPLMLPLIVSGLFYTIGNLAPNTSGQFAFFILNQLAGLTPQVVGNVLFSLAPLGLTTGLLFVRLVDSPWRHGVMVAGGMLQIAAFVVPAWLGFSPGTYLVAFYAGFLGNAFIGEALYKVRMQEIFPTLVRGTAQGVTIFACRIVTALFALITPAFATANPGALMWLLAGLNALTLALGLWLSRLGPAPSRA